MTGQFDDAASAGAEQMVLRRHPHWIRMAAPAVHLGGALTLLEQFRAHIGSGPSASYAIFIIATPFGISLAKRVVEVRSMSFVVTTRRIGVRRVFLSRRERYIWLQKVNDLRLHQGLIQRLFGCGNLIVESSGEADQLVLRYVPDVNSVHGTLMQLIMDEEDPQSS